MSSSFSSAIRAFVASRADYRCEYCRKPEIISNFSFHLEHIISRQHGGGDHLENLAFACSWCNWKKGPNIATIIPGESSIIPLFHPRKDAWNLHFRVEEGQIIGRTDIGKGTVRLLKMNKVELVMERNILIDAGLF